MSQTVGKTQETLHTKSPKTHLQRALVQDAMLQVDIQPDLPLVEELLQLDVGLFQLQQHRLHMGDRAALRPETNAPRVVKQSWKQTQLERKKEQNETLPHRIH